MRGTKWVSWGAPKHIQRLITRDSKSVPSRKPKHHCNKLKGAHVYEWVQNNASWTDRGYEERCTACGKKRGWVWLEKGETLQSGIERMAKR